MQISELSLGRVILLHNKALDSGLALSGNKVFLSYFFQYLTLSNYSILIYHFRLTFHFVIRLSISNSLSKCIQDFKHFSKEHFEFFRPFADLSSIFFFLLCSIIRSNFRIFLHIIKPPSKTWFYSFFISILILFNFNSRSTFRAFILSCKIF